MNNQQTNLIKIIRCALHKVPCEELTQPDFSEITTLAEKHKLSAFLFEAMPYLAAEQIPEQLLVLWKKLYRSQIIVEANQRYEFENLLDALNEAEIKALPVKGFAIADCYPSPSLRAMSDFDILYEETKKETLLPVMQRLGYKTMSVGGGTTDQFFSETGIHAELHRTLYEDRMPQQTKPFFSDLFALAEADSKPFVYRLSSDDEYRYLLLHTYKHFVFAGTGIRSALDVYVFKDRVKDKAALEQWCSRAGIGKFREELERLSDYWFGEGDASAITEQFGDYIAGGGVYGSEENKMHSQMLQADNGRGVGKLKYILRRFFLPYRAMTHEYPILKKLPFLLPFFWIYRAVYALCHRRERLSAEIQNLSSYDSSQADRLSGLMKALEIQR